MEKSQAVAEIRTIFERDEIIEYNPEDVVENGDAPFCAGVFYTRPGPRGDLLCAGDLRAEGSPPTHATLLNLEQLVDITYAFVGEEGLEIYFELGGEGVITHQVRWSCSEPDAETFRPTCSEVDIASLDTHRRYHGAYGMSLMETLANGYHTPNVQMAIEEQFEHHLFGKRQYPDIRALEALEKCLRADVLKGVQRSAMQYALLCLHGSEDARCVFDRDIAVHHALVLEGVPALIRDCLAYHCSWSDVYGGVSKALLDIDGLVISGELRDDYEVTRFDLEWIDRDDS